METCCYPVFGSKLFIDCSRGFESRNKSCLVMSIEGAAPDRSSGDLRVFTSTRDSRCDECGDDLGRRAWIFLAGDRGALGLTCADLDHLVFLPSGDAALTRRARNHSKLAAVVLKWSRARQQSERQGLLVEETALQRAEAEC